VRKSPDRLETAGKLRTFKIERLRTIKLLDATYTIPPDFDPRNKLKDAWGIWYTEKEPIEVVLRFSRQVAHRIRETQWHHTEKIEEQEDGSLIWRAQIAGWFEMLSWIKGWGSGCIVLAPDDLRLAVAEDMAKAARNYGGE
jgi:CRISPR-associated endonuclease/helicase Cas3